MAKINIFNDFILTGFIENENLNKRIFEILEKSKKEKNGRQLTNRGGFQTNDLQDDYLVKIFKEKTKNLLLENFEIHHINFNLHLNNFWINENNKTNFNVRHTHPKADISAVYYSKILEKGGYINFHRSNDVLDFTNLMNLIKTKDTEMIHSIQPLNNMFIIFPSYLQHSVDPSPHDNRISTAINFTIKL